jgi:hypothetical protein
MSAATSTEEEEEASIFDYDNTSNPPSQEQHYTFLDEQRLLYTQLLTKNCPGKHQSLQHQALDRQSEGNAQWG